MTSKDLFVTALRVIGVLQLIRAFEFALEAFDVFSGYYRPVSTTIGSAMTHTVLLFLLGVYLLLGAPAITRAIFSRSSDAKSDDEKPPSNGDPEV